MVLVSVVLPIRDDDASVVGALESVLGQRHDDLEVVVVGGPTRGASVIDVSDRYSDDGRVRVVELDSLRGLAGRFNRGAEAAEGEFLCPMLASDRWHPTKLERQLECFADLSKRYGLVYAGGVLYQRGIVTRRYRPHWRGDVYPEILAAFEIEPFSSHMIRREAFESVGGFDDAFDPGVDWEFAIRLAREYRFEYVDAPLVQRFATDDVTPREGGERTNHPFETPRRIRESYADAYESHPSIRRRFEKTNHVSAAVYALRNGDRLRALRHAGYAFRRHPSLETSLVLGCSVAGSGVLEYATRLRRLAANVRTSPDAVRRGMW